MSGDAKRKLEAIAADASFSLAQRHVRVAAVVSGELAKAGVRAVVVGGSAVELYANDMDRYATQDIDMVLSTTENVRKVMEECGFQAEGGVWFIPDTDIIVEFPKGPLAGDAGRLTAITVKGIDAKALYLGLEDVIIDRCNDFKFWQTEKARVAEYLLGAYYDELDFGYLKRRAKEELCDDVLKRFIKQYRIRMGHISAENPRRKAYFASGAYKAQLDDFKEGLLGASESWESEAKAAILAKHPRWGAVSDLLLIQLLKGRGWDDLAICEEVAKSPTGFGLKMADKWERARQMMRRYERYKKRGRLPPLYSLARRFLVNHGISRTQDEP